MSIVGDHLRDSHSCGAYYGSTREWVGLTKDEVTEALGQAEAMGMSLYRFAAIVEHKLKDKNS